jgi:hypothetical protein
MHFRSAAGHPLHLILVERLDKAGNQRADNPVWLACVVRSQEQIGTFTITGTGGLPQRPGDRSLLPYATGSARAMEQNEEQPWQPGEAIVKPQGVYQLDDRRMVLSRECE